MIKHYTTDPKKIASKKRTKKQNGNRPLTIAKHLLKIYDNGK
jgi:hypothetical protein